MHCLVFDFSISILQSDFTAFFGSSEESVGKSTPFFKLKSLSPGKKKELGTISEHASLKDIGLL
jgi:hypothetical protein